MKMELRVQNAELDANSDGTLKVSGYVNKTNQHSEILGTTKRFKEKIAKGAFSKAIRAANQINFLAEHDTKKILASTRNGSLELTEDEQGLFMSAKISSTSWGRDSYQLIKDGILQNMSFGFRTIRDSWKDIGSNLYERTIEELELFEVSVVEKPAYTSSTIAARGIKLVEQVTIPEEITQQNQKERINNMRTIETIRYGTEIRKESNPQLDSFKSYITGLESSEVRSEVEAVRSTFNSTGVTGGALVPEKVYNKIIAKLEERSPVFEMARKIPSVSGTMKIPREDTMEDAGFVAETFSVKAISLALKEVMLQGKRVGAAISPTNQLLLDSGVNMEDYIAELLAKETFKAIEKSILIGDGVEGFKGIVNDDLVPIVEASTIGVDDLMDLHNTIHSDYANEKSAFIMNRDTFNEFTKLKDALGHSYVQNGEVNGKLTRTLFGKPIYLTHVLPADTPVIFGSFYHAYAVMVQQGMRLQKTVDTDNALRGTSTFVLDAHMDGAVYNPQAIAKLKIKTA